MKYTVAEVTNSGSFGYDPTDLKYASNLEDCKGILYRWGRMHEQVGTTMDYAYIYIFKGVFDDVTDMYPDKMMYFGPRGGIKVENC